MFLFTVCGVSHHSLYIMWIFCLLQLFIDIYFKLFTYCTNGNYSRLYLAQFHIGNPFLFSRADLEVDLFTFWGVYDPLFFSVIGDELTTFI